MRLDSSARKGMWAERFCVLSLKLRCYTVIARRLRMGRRANGTGEIDIVARRGRVLAFIEVKMRSRREDALEALRPIQKDRIMRAAEVFVARTPEVRTLEPRFDLMIVVPWRWPYHLTNAWSQDKAW